MVALLLFAGHCTLDAWLSTRFEFVNNCLQVKYFTIASLSISTLYIPLDYYKMYQRRQRIKKVSLDSRKKEIERIHRENDQIDFLVNKKLKTKHRRNR